jgi:hypothetical protein
MVEFAMTLQCTELNQAPHETTVSCFELSMGFNLRYLTTFEPMNWTEKAIITYINFLCSWLCNLNNKPHSLR